MANDLLLRLPHRLVTLTLPKMLRVFFKHDRKLFSEISRLIFDMVQDHLNEAAKTRVETASVLCFQSFGEFLRWNSHFHGERQLCLHTFRQPVRIKCTKTGNELRPGFSENIRRGHNCQLWLHLAWLHTLTFWCEQNCEQFLRNIEIFQDIIRSCRLT